MRAGGACRQLAGVALCKLVPWEFQNVNLPDHLAEVGWIGRDWSHMLFSFENGPIEDPFLFWLVRRRKLIPALLQLGQEQHLSPIHITCSAHCIGLV